MIQDAQALVFPCDYPIKAMGLAEPGFDLLVVELIRQHCPNLREGAVKLRESRNGKYVSVTVNIVAESHAQLEAIYAALTAHDKVLMRL